MKPQKTNSKLLSVEQASRLQIVRIHSTSVNPLDIKTITNFPEKPDKVGSNT